MMKQFTFTVLLSFSLILSAQQKQISLEDIWSNNTFRTESIASLRSMNSGYDYTVIEFNEGDSEIVQYEYKGMTKKGVVLTSGDDEIPDFSTYAFSDDESKILIGTKIRPIFRRSRIGVYYVYTLNGKSLVAVDDDPIQSPAFSPNGDKVAYVKENNIYIFDIVNNSRMQITSDGEKGKIINGLSDWVYEEEFSIVRAFEWNSSGSHIAYLKFDESEVPMFSMDIYGKGLYQYPYTFKYPKAGEKNAELSLHLFDVNQNSHAKVKLPEVDYIPRIKWMNAPELLTVQTLNRHQNHLKMYKVNAVNNSVDLFFEEQDDAYVDIHDNLTFLEDDDFIWTSERDGFNHLYLYNADGTLKRQITSGDWEVTSYYGYDAKRDRIFYQSTEQGSTQRHVYSINAKGKRKTLLTPESGTNSAQFSKQFYYFINTHHSSNTPYQFTLHLARNGMQMMMLKDNKALKNRVAEFAISPKEFSTLRVGDHDLNMYMIKPLDFDPSKTYPLLMFQYSGPGSQQVGDRWNGTNDYWHQMLAQQGYIIACVDGRGTGFKGRDFKKSTYLNLVKYETEDQIAAAKLLSQRSYIDEDRTGIWGWSFGGHMSTNAILKGNDTFEVAIAVAPVTSWRFYDTIYTERFLRTPDENPEGYDNESPFNYPELLKGKYLLVHGSGDDNVHVQNSMRMIDALIQANKPFEWAIYPDRNHGIYGGNTRLHLYNKMTSFIKDNL
ncbi:MAG: S9 family peptidase [Flavobacteriaceae bacterium]